ncbi:MAG: hypothetical protein CM15mP85_05260 [Rhodobacterales bacterium]|nr:MAG: hypothetical protein CM15mP85_05260 [Rhodobacterales bacterium]
MQLRSAMGLKQTCWAAVPDTEIEVKGPCKGLLFDSGVLLAILRSINAVGATPSDLVAILEALREAGALMRIDSYLEFFNGYYK